MASDREVVPEVSEPVDEWWLLPGDLFAHLQGLALFILQHPDCEQQEWHAVVAREQGQQGHSDLLYALQNCL